MSIFGSIMSKLGFGDKQVEAAAAPVTAAPVSTQAVPSAAVAAAPVAADFSISAVDVVAKMEELASAHAEKLNWKTSIVDLLKLLGLDSSLASRKTLAGELNCPANLMGDSAQMNMWLHKAVLQKLAENGGLVTTDLMV